ncbi:hypothetical protein J3458_005031 [Metarhizium acridum]|uniref:uncharacterized protein n=1 Tax=Metarhizium acridum TaxID=92637 RepID=UPI001C6CC514|nr:hypothetical protein J3458_005031 [Metarhizium acridum]
MDAIDSFKLAMEAVYGPLDNLTVEDAEEWTPPASPGAGGHRGRYLWTDAFGVINFLTLYKETSMVHYLNLAARLVYSVHDILGRTRDGSHRLPGATEDAPLTGGLRIGKVAGLGADCDGQYHHYLTIWMFALNRMSVATGEPKFNNWAMELGKAIHPHFIVPDVGGNKRMVWKISTDMDEVLVPSEGHLDAATGFAVYRLLQQTADLYGKGDELSLRAEIGDYSAIMMRPGKLAPTSDFLDLGMGLWMCQFCLDEPWADKFVETSLRMLRDRLEHSRGSLLQRYKRLAFREFGAYLGVRCIGADKELQDKVETLIKSWDVSGGHIDEELKPISHVTHASALIPGGEFYHVYYLHSF